MRRRKAEENSNTAAVQPWMLTLVDVMSLLLTFFVVLVSLSSFDELSQQVVLDSVKTIFGTEKKPLFPFDTSRSDDRNRFGPAHNERADNLQNIRKILLENEAPTNDVLLSQNGQHIIISINNDLMFEPGRTAVSVEGKKILARLAPYLRNMPHPMLIAGHSAPGMDETGFATTMLNNSTEQTWALSMERAAEVYIFFTGNGVSPISMNMEAYGEHRPRFSNLSPAGRRDNRRVDLVLDKRNELFGKESGLRQRQNTDKTFNFKNFEFDLTYPRQR